METKENKVPAILQELREAYKTSGSSKYINTLLYGGMGSGKTTLLRTAVKPVLIHSFDPGGAKVLTDEIDRGEIIVDTSFEKEDAKKPSVYMAWDKAYERLKNADVFSQIGTYVIDSLTLFSDAMMNEILRRNGRAGTTPQLQDYMVQITTTKQYVASITSLPCHTILIGHIEADKDELTGRMMTSLMITGKLKDKIPILIDEVYMTCTKESSKGVEYMLLTKNTGLYKARTRIGRNGIFETYEEPNLKSLLKRGGYDAEDKPLLLKQE